MDIFHHCTSQDGHVGILQRKTLLPSLDITADEFEAVWKRATA